MKKRINIGQSVKIPKLKSSSLKSFPYLKPLGVTPLLSQMGQTGYLSDTITNVLIKRVEFGHNIHLHLSALGRMPRRTSLLLNHFYLRYVF